MGLALQTRLRAGFLDIAAAHPVRFAVIDGGRDAQAVAADVLACAKARLP